MAIEILLLRRPPGGDDLPGRRILAAAKWKSLQGFPLQARSAARKNACFCWQFQQSFHFSERCIRGVLTCQRNLARAVAGKLGRKAAGAQYQPSREPSPVCST